MPWVVVTAVLVQVLIVTIWVGLAYLAAIAVWGSVVGIAPLFGSGAGMTVLYGVVGLAALAFCTISIVGLLDIFRRKAPGTTSLTLQAFGMIVVVALGATGVLPGGIVAVLLVPLVVVNAVLVRVGGSRRWFDAPYAHPLPTQRTLVLAVTTTLSTSLWLLFFTWAVVMQLASLLVGTSSRLPAVALLLAGLVSSTVVVVRLCRAQRPPRVIALVGAILAGLGAIWLSIAPSWLVGLAIFSSALLWLPDREDRQ